MNYLKNAIAAVARLFLSATFLVSGIMKMIYWKKTEMQFMKAIGDWQTYTAIPGTFQTFFNTVIAWAPMIVGVATFIEILGALLLLFGLKERLGAALLVIFLIPMTILMQHFWFPEGGERELQLSLFLRDLAVLGGLLIVVLHGGHGRPRGSNGHL
jgi:putative oxidoreductase